MASPVKTYIVKAKSIDVLGTLISDVMGLGVKIEHVYRHTFPGFSAKLTNLYLKSLKNDSRIDFIEESGEVHTYAKYNNAPWHLDRIDQRQVPLSGSYTYNSDGTGVIAYTLDTGCVYFNPEKIASDTSNFDHVELIGRVKPVNKLDSFGVPIAGIVFDPIYDTLQATDPENSRLSSPRGFDHNGHGTHVAGLIGSTAYGVAKNVEIRSSKVLDVFGKGTISNVIAGIEAIIGDYNYNTSGEPAVCNMSLGTTAPVNPEPSGVFELAVQSLVDMGITVVVAAGNEGQDANNISPARMSSVITVGATGRIVNSQGVVIGDTIANFSNFGNNEDIIADEELGFNESVQTNTGSALDIFAPGVGIISTYKSTPTALNTLSGTSMSAPLVAGTAVLILENNPFLLPSGVKTVLLSNATSGIIEGVPFGTSNELLYSTFVDHEIEWITAAGSLGGFPEGHTLNPGVILQAAGFTGQPLTYSTPFGGLPVGISINSATGRLEGTAQAVATDTVFNFTVRASDGDGFVDRSFSLTILDGALPPNWLTNNNLSSVEEGELLNIQFSALSRSTPPTSITYTVVNSIGSPVSLPYGWTLSSSGILNGLVPLVINFDTPVSFIIRADDGQAFADRIFTILIKQSSFTQPPVWISSSLLGTIVRFEPVNIQLLATDADNNPQPIKYKLQVISGDGSILGSSTVLPTGLVLDEDTGIISGAFTGNMVDGLATAPTTFDNNTTTFDSELMVFEHSSVTFSFQVFAVDGSQVVGRLFTIEVLSQPANQPITWITPSGSLGTINALAFYNVGVVATDPDNSPQPVKYKIVSGSLPPGMVLNTNTGIISGVPFNITEAIKTSIFGVEASDGESMIVRTFAITVKRINQEPQWITPSGLLFPAINEGSQFSFQLVAVDPNGGDQLRYTVISSSESSTTFDTELMTFDGGTTTMTDIVSAPSELPPGITLNSLTGVLSGRVDDIETNTIFEFAVRVDDGLSNIASEALFSDRVFSIQVTDGALNVNKAPIWITPSGALADGIENEHYRYELLATDSDGPQPLKYLLSAGALPTGLTLNTTTGVISGFPNDADFLDTEYIFEIRITDGAAFSLRTFSITILDAGNPNNSPVWITASGNIGSYDELTPMVFALSAVDPEGTNVTFTDSTNSLPTGLTVTASGIINGIPPQVTSDTVFNFTIEANDEDGGITSQNFSITVVDVPNTPPVWVTSTNLGTFAEGAFIPIAVQAVDPDTGPSTLTYVNTSGSGTHLPEVPVGAVVGLPPGLSLSSTGIISGITSVLVDTVYSFEVTVDDGAASVPEQFVMTITNTVDIPTERSELVVRITGNQRQQFKSWNTNTLISDGDLYEPLNPDFGRQIEPNILIMKDIHTTTPVDITAAFGPHHKRFDVLLGLPNSAVVRDINGNIIYEVIYLNVIDPQKGSDFDIITGTVPSALDTNGIETYVSKNFDHLRTELNLLPNSEILPDWMTSEQILGDSSSILGYTPAIELAYVKPGTSDAIIDELNFFETETVIVSASETTFDVNAVFGTEFSPVVSIGDSLFITNGSDPTVEVVFNAPYTLAQVVQDINDAPIPGITATVRNIEQFVPDFPPATWPGQFIFGDVLAITHDQPIVEFSGSAQVTLGLPSEGGETIWNDGSTFDNSTTTEINVNKGPGFQFVGRRVTIDRYLYDDNASLSSLITSYDGDTTTFDGDTTIFLTYQSHQKWIKFSSDTQRPMWITDKGLLGGYDEGDSVSIQLEGESQIGGSVTYSIIYGSLPDGLTLSSSGLISGTVNAGADEFLENYFVVRITDINDQTADRGFDILIGAPTVFDSGLTTFDGGLMTLDVA